MDSHRTFEVSNLGSAAKENLPPKMAKQKVSVEGLFKQQQDISKKRAKDEQNIFAPTATKTSASRPSIFSQFAVPKKAKNHPVFASFGG